MRRFGPTPLFAVPPVAAGLAGGSWLLRNRPPGRAVAVEKQGVPICFLRLGTVEARGLSRVGSEGAGTRVTTEADPGDRVGAGAVLARLDLASQEARAARDETRLENAEAQQLRITAADECVHVLARRRCAIAARWRELAAYGDALLETAEQADPATAAAQADVALTRAELATARAALAAVRAALLAERTALPRHMLSTPYDALVIARHRGPGAAPAPGKAVFTLVESGALWAFAHMDEGRAGATREGQPAKVRRRSLPGEAFPARVARIGLESGRASEGRQVNLRRECCPPQPILGEQIAVDRLDRLISWHDGRIAAETRLLSAA